MWTSVREGQGLPHTEKKRDILVDIHGAAGFLNALLLSLGQLGKMPVHGVLRADISTDPGKLLGSPVRLRECWAVTYIDDGDLGHGVGGETRGQMDERW